MTPSENPMIYLDSNATHPLLKNVREGLSQAIICEDPRLANPSSIHRRGQSAKKQMAELRDALCAYLGRPDGDEFIFLSGATEAINLALRGFVRERQAAGRVPVLMASTVEHSAVLDTLKDLSCESQLLSVTTQGQLDAKFVEESIAEKIAIETQDVLLCLQLCNNETGVAFDLDTILSQLVARFAPQPQKNLPKIKGGKYVYSPQRLFIFIDAAQALGKMDESEVRRALHFADYNSLSAHKMGGPAGVGALWIRPRVPFFAQVTGGVQERKRRAGTANAIGLLGFHLALNFWISEGEKARARLSYLRQIAYQGLKEIPGLHVHGLSDKDQSLPKLVNTLNFHVEGCPEESLLLALDLDGFCVSSGSACNSGSLRPSHVLQAMGYSNEISLSSIRLSLGVENTEAEVLSFVSAVRAKVEQILKARAYSRTILSDNDSPNADLYPEIAQPPTEIGL